MKFSAKTVMKTATFKDMALGSAQASLVTHPLSGFINSSKSYHREGFKNFNTWFFLVVASSALIYSIWNFYKVSRGTKIMSTLKDSLLGDDEDGLDNEESSEKSKSLLI